MSAGDRDTLAALLAEHDALRSHGPGTGWFCRGCGQKMTDWPTPEQCRPHESAMEVVHRAHLADVLLASDWLREQRTEAWDDGWKEHGIDSGSCTCQSCFFGYTDDRDRLNPYRRTEK